MLKENFISLIRSGVVNDCGIEISLLEVNNISYLLLPKLDVAFD